MRIALLIFACIIALFAESLLEFKLAFKNINSDVIKDISKYAVSEKFDGVRGIWNGTDMLTKRGNRIEIPLCFREKLEAIPLKDGEFIEGELWSGYNSFETTSGIVRLKKPKCEDYGGIRYLIFNVRLVDSSDFLVDLERLHIPKCGESQMCVIPQIRVDSAATLNEMLKNVLDKGGEGLIVRDNNIAFKLKAYNDAECEIVGYSQGKGRLENKVGAIVCKSLADKNHNIKQGIIFRIGSGLSDNLRENPPKIGTIITYQFNGLNKNGIPKYARFKRIFDEY